MLGRVSNTVTVLVSSLLARSGSDHLDQVSGLDDVDVLPVRQDIVVKEETDLIMMLQLTVLTSQLVKHISHCRP